MKLPRRALFCLLALPLQTLAQGAMAQELLDSDMQREKAALQKKVEEFFLDLTDKAVGPDQAVRALVASGPLKERGEELTKLIEQAATLEQRYGAYSGNEVVDTKAIGSGLLRLRYLYKAEKFPIVWQFTFYRTEITTGIHRDWSLIALRFDTELEEVLR